MSSELTLSLKLTADGTGLRGELRLAQDELAKLRAAGGQAATGLNTTVAGADKAAAAIGQAARATQQGGQALGGVQATATGAAGALAHLGEVTSRAGQAAQSAGAPIGQVDASLAGLDAAGKQAAGGGLTQVGGAAGRARDEFGRLAGGAGQAEAQLQRTGQQAVAAGRQLGTMRDVASQVRGALATLGVTFGAAVLVRQTISATEALQSMESRLTRLTGSAAKAAQEQRWLQETAADLSADLVGLGENWSRMLGLVSSGIITIEQGRSILTGFANVAAATGAGNVQLGQSFYGLGQALSSGVVHTEEYAQVTEPLIGFSNALDRAFVKVTGSTESVAGSMRRAVVDGKVTSELFGRVLVEALNEYEGAARQMAGNLQQQFTRLGNEWDLLLEAFARPATRGGGLIDDLTDGLRFLRDNIELTRIAVVGLGGAFTIAFAGGAIVRAVSTLAGLFGLLATPLGVVVAGGVALGAVLKRISDDGVDAGRAVDVYRDALHKAEEARVAAEGGNDALAKQLRTIAEVAMAAAEAIRGIALAHYQARISELRQQLAALPSELDVERTVNPSARQRQQAETRGLVEGELSSILNDPDYKALRDPSTITLPPEDGTGGGGGGLPPSTKKGADALKDLLDRLDPLGAALRGLAEDQAVLTAAFDKGRITGGDYAILTAKLKDSYQEALDPLGALLDQYRQEIELLGLSADEREIQQALLQQEQALKAKGLELGATELQQLRETIVARRQAQAAADSRERTSGLGDQLTLLQAEIDLQSTSSSERELRLALIQKELELRREGLDLSSKEAQAELAATEQLVRKKQELEDLQDQQDEIQQAFERGFDRIGEAITQAFADGSIASLDFGQIAKAVLSELLQEMFRIMVLNPLKKAFGDVLGSIGGWLSPSSTTSPTIGTNITGSGGGLFQTFVGSAHGGGMVGAIPSTRSVDPGVFANARRYHAGGDIGLMAGEVPIIAKAGEEVLTGDDPRNRRNGGRAPKVEVHVHEAPGTRSTVRQQRNGEDLRIDILVEQLDEAQAQRIAQGNSKSAMAMERKYGINRNNGELA